MTLGNSGITDEENPQSTTESQKYFIKIRIAQSVQLIIYINARCNCANKKTVKYENDLNEVGKKSAIIDRQG